MWFQSESVKSAVIFANQKQLSYVTTKLSDSANIRKKNIIYVVVLPHLRNIIAESGNNNSWYKFLNS